MRRDYSERLVSSDSTLSVKLVAKRWFCVDQVESWAMRMTNWILSILVLVPMALPARAEWQEIEKFEDGMRVYVDRATARRDGETAQVVHLVRWAEPQEENGQAAYRSTVVRTVYDCRNKRERYLSSLSFSGPMGDGIKVAADGQEVEHWYSISDASMEEKLWKVACSAR